MNPEFCWVDKDGADDEPLTEVAFWRALDALQFSMRLPADPPDDEFLRWLDESADRVRVAYESEVLRALGREVVRAHDREWERHIAETRRALQRRHGAPPPYTGPLLY